MAGGKLYRTTNPNVPQAMRYRNRKRRHRRRSHMNKNHKLTIIKGLQKQVIPERFVTKVTYNAYLTVGNGTSDYASYYVFRGNSIYDPDFTGVGGQPLYHDQLALLYQQYKVYGSKIKVSWINNGTSHARLAVTPANTSTAFTDIEQATEQQRATNRHLTVKGGARDMVVISKYASTSNILGFEGKSFDDSAEADFGANPTEEWYWHLTAESGIPSSTYYLSTYAEVQLTYYIECFEPIVLARS